MAQSVEGGALFTGFGAGASGVLGIGFINGGSISAATIDGNTAGGAVVSVGAGVVLGNI